jgi:hypothetical protein
MQDNGLARRIAAEFGGTATLLATVVGSGVMAERLGWLLHPKGYPEAGASRQKRAAAKE